VATVSIPLKLVNDVVVNTATAGDQVGPIVERLANGNYVVIWTDNSHGVGGATGDSDGTAVKGQLLAPDGSKIGSEFLVNVTTAGDQAPTSVHATPDGGFQVFWSSGTGFKARTFDDDGTPTGGEVDTPFSNGVRLADGGFVVPTAATEFDVYDSNFALVRHVDVNGESPYYENAGPILALPNGDFGFVWGQAFTFNGATPLPKLVIYHADGTAATGVISLAGGGLIPMQASGFALDSGVMVIVAFYSSGGTGVTVLNSAGEKLWQISQVESASATPLDGDGFIVTYRSSGTDYSQHFEEDGSQDGGPVAGGIPVPADDVVAIDVASDGSGQGIHSRYSQAVPNDATEQVNLSLKDLQMSVSDTGSPRTATLSVDYGVLFVTPGTSGASVSGSGTSTVTITGTIAQINALLNTNPTSTVDYQANTDDPPAEAVLTLSLGTASAAAVIHIIGVDDTGTAADDAVATDEGTTLAITPLANDDPDGNASFATVNGVALAVGQSTTLASGAIVTRTGAETLAYDPNGAFDALAQGATDTDSFGYTIGGGSAATVTVTINGLAGTSGNDFFDLSGGGDVVVGGSRGNDTFSFGAAFTAADRINGGDGSNDTLRLDGDYSAGVRLVATTMTGVEQILLIGGFDYVLATNDANVAAGGLLTVNGLGLGAGDNLTFLGGAESDGRFIVDGGAGADNLVGGAGSDTLGGGAGNDVLDGGAGSDTVAGGLGDDTFAVDALGDSVVEAAGEGSDRVYTSVTYRLTAGQEIELLTAANQAGTQGINLAGNDFGQAIFGSDGVNLLEGLGGDDALYGLGGNDTLDGGAGGDQMVGGTGNDVYYVDGPGDNVVELAGQGNDFVWVRGSFRLGLGSEVEYLSAAVVPDTATINIAGSDTAQTITGNFGANSLEGFGGDDVLDGTYGNDTLDGGTGVNLLYGGFGDDTFAVSGDNDTVIEQFGEGNDRVLAYGSYTLPIDADVELLAAGNQSGTQALDLIGNIRAQTIIGNAGANHLDGQAGNDTLFGLEGDDVLDGGIGADVMVGGAGNDWFVIDNESDQVIDAVGGGYDRIFTTIDYRLGESQEFELLMTSNPAGTAALHLAGNNLSNTIIGNAGANFLEGHGGVDRLEGAAGDDQLDGGADGDVLNGGAGADQFRFFSAFDGSFDRIEDFVSEVDMIALSRTKFTGLVIGGVPASAFVIGTAATDADDRLIYNQATGQIFYDSDGTGSAAAIQFAQLQPGTTLAAFDFVVI
jgi:Ca2+-binding RTX toxin-like protein